jgi:hypothetical protein
MDFNVAETHVFSYMESRIVPPFQGWSMVGFCTQGDTRSARFALGYHLPPFQG